MFEPAYAPDTSYLGEIQERYGSTFEQITKPEKLFLVSTIASHLCAAEATETRNEIYELGVDLLQKLPAIEQAALLETLIAQISWGEPEQQNPESHD